MQIFKEIGKMKFLTIPMKIQREIFLCWVYKNNSFMAKPCCYDDKLPWEGRTQIKVHLSQLAGLLFIYAFNNCTFQRNMNFLTKLFIFYDCCFNDLLIGYNLKFQVFFFFFVFLLLLLLINHLHEPGLARRSNPEWPTDLSVLG